MIRRLSFASYTQDIDTSRGLAYTDLPYLAKLVVKFELLSKRPFYSLNLDHQLTQSLDFENIDRVFSYARDLLDTSFTVDKGAVKLSKKLMQEISYCVFHGRGALMG